MHDQTKILIWFHMSVVLDFPMKNGTCNLNGHLRRGKKGIHAHHNQELYSSQFHK